MAAGQAERHAVPPPARRRAPGRRRADCGTPGNSAPKQTGLLRHALRRLRAADSAAPALQLDGEFEVPQFERAQAARRVASCQGRLDQRALGRGVQLRPWCAVVVGPQVLSRPEPVARLTT